MKAVNDKESSRAYINRIIRTENVPAVLEQVLISHQSFPLLEHKNEPNMIEQKYTIRNRIRNPPPKKKPFILGLAI